MTAFQVTARVWFEQALYASIQNRRIPRLPDYLQALDKSAGPHFRRRSHMVPRNGGRMDHEAALLHGKLPLLQLPLRLRPNVRLLALRAVSGGGQSVCAQAGEGVVGGQQCVTTGNRQNRRLRCGRPQLLERRLKSVSSASLLTWKKSFNTCQRI